LFCIDSYLIILYNAKWNATIQNMNNYCSRMSLYHAFAYNLPVNNSISNESGDKSVKKKRISLYRCTNQVWYLHNCWSFLHKIFKTKIVLQHFFNHPLHLKEYLNSQILPLNMASITKGIDSICPSKYFGDEMCRWLHIHT
jgi:hypothetical protein